MIITITMLTFIWMEISWVIHIWQQKTNSIWWLLFCQVISGHNAVLCPVLTYLLENLLESRDYQKQKTAQNVVPFSAIICSMLMVKDVDIWDSNDSDQHWPIYKMSCKQVKMQSTNRHVNQLKCNEQNPCLHLQSIYKAFLMLT